MNYRSISDLARVIRENIYKVPSSVDLVVGVPRSGALAASMVALNLNLPLSDVGALLTNAPLQGAGTRMIKGGELRRPYSARHILVVDDSVLSGKSLEAVKIELSRIKYNGTVSYCAIYATKHSRTFVDIFFEIVASPRAFEWNIMHRPMLSSCCVDIDGVLCVDPTSRQNDDGISYRTFIGSANALCIPTYPIGYLVSSRLEKYRHQTEQWLATKCIKYEQLFLLDLPNASMRRRLGVHASFKASIYRDLRNSSLFIESDRDQAIDIANLSGKPALSVSSQELFQPHLSRERLRQDTSRVAGRIERAIKKLGRRLSG